MTGIRADRTVIRSSMADLLDTNPSPEVIVKATATMCHLWRGAHLPGEPSLGSLCREMPWRGSDHVSFGGVGRLGKFSPAVNHPTRHRPAVFRRSERCRKFSGTVTTTGFLSGVGCPPVGHEVCTHHTNRTALDRRTRAPGRAGHGPAGRAGAAPGRLSPRPDPAARTRCKLDNERRCP